MRLEECQELHLRAVSHSSRYVIRTTCQEITRNSCGRRRMSKIKGSLVIDLVPAGGSDPVWRGVYRDKAADRVEAA
jgi:hypothetical protein